MTMREETTYLIASVTKTFVATAIMMLVEEGALELGRGITGFVARFKDGYNYFDSHPESIIAFFDRYMK
jgi:CubicO group peptidase (beta-lactamase class C family)